MHRACVWQTSDNQRSAPLNESTNDPVTKCRTPYGVGVLLWCGPRHIGGFVNRVSPMRIRLALIIVLTAVSCGASGQIFRTVDANGNVVFTDIAPVDRSGQPPATAVTVPPTNTVPAPAAPAARANETPAAADAPFYTTLAVVSPANGETVRDNAGNVRIEVTSTPPLRTGDRLLLILNGSPNAAEAVNGVFQLSHVDRGTHAAGVRIVDGNGKTVMEGNPITFHLMRAAASPTTPVPLPRPSSAN